MFTTLRYLIPIVNPSFSRRFLYGYLYNLLRSSLRIRSESVLLESHHGADVGGNPYYIAAYLASHQEYRNLRLIIVGPAKRKRWLQRRLKSRRITLIRPRSLRYVFYLATCKWLISDVTFPAYFSRRKGQRYLNTWHGTPLKSLGRGSLIETALHLLNIQRNFLHADFLVAPNGHTETVLLESYCLKGLYGGCILRSGYPRNDPLSCDGTSHRDGVALSVAFMPTWRGRIADRTSDSRRQVSVLLDDLADLDELLPESVTLWVKLHALVSAEIDFTRYRRIRPFPQDVETYQHLASCDVLVTDYSSVLFDFALTGRPIVRYTADEDAYVAERGFCLDPGTLPFPCARTVHELAALIGVESARSSFALNGGYAAFRESFNALDRGTGARDVCRAFLDSCDASTEPVLDSTVAIYIGKPSRSPATYSRLLKDLTQFGFKGVLLIDADHLTPEWETWLRNLDPKLLYVVIRFHTYISPLELVRLGWSCLVRRQGVCGEEVWRTIALRECNRLFGSARFSYLISLDGRSAGSDILRAGRRWKGFLSLSIGDALEDAGELRRLLQSAFGVRCCPVEHEPSSFASNSDLK